MSRLLKFSAAALLVAPVIAFTASVKADSPGQLGGGPDVYKVKNVTKNGSYAASASAACNEEVRYSVRLHNAAYGSLTNVQVKANLADGTMTATPAEGASAGTNGKVTVTVAAGGNLVYQNGTAKFYDANGKELKTLPDTITTSGVNVGNLNGSTTHFVNFQAKVNCPVTPTPTPTPTPKPTPAPAPVTKAPEALPNTGAGSVLAAFAGASAAGTAAHAVVSRLRRK